MIRLTCPECHSRCRLKTEQSKQNFSYGRCPACGHRFPLPATGDQQDIIKIEPDKSQKENRKQLKRIWKDVTRERTLGLIKNPLFISSLGLVLVLLLLAISLRSNRPVTSIQKNNQTQINTLRGKTAPESELKPAKTETVELELTPETRARAIAQIKHHALVADADINVYDQQLQLALLVSDKTPVSYSERLGRQFVHYVKELIPKEQPQPSFLISVYYPDGTRIEVTTNNQFLEEEVILEMENEE